MIRKSILPILSSILVLLLAQGLVAAPALPEGLSVVYADGEAARLLASSWKPLAVGDRIPSDSLVRLGPSSYLELAAAGTRLCLSAPGSYSLKTLLSARSRDSTLSRIGNYLSTLSGGGAEAPTAIAGTRGANQAQDDTDWVTSDAEVFLDSGRSFLSVGATDKAIAQFRSALDVADGSEKELASYWLGRAYASSGDYRTALPLLSPLAPAPSEDWAADWTLLLSRVWLETTAPQSAIDLLSGRGAALAGDSRYAQGYHLLLGTALGDAGRKAEALAALDRAIALGAGTEGGRAAAELRRGIAQGQP